MRAVINDDYYYQLVVVVGFIRGRTQSPVRGPPAELVALAASACLQRRRWRGVRTWWCMLPIKYICLLRPWTTATPWRAATRTVTLTEVGSTRTMAPAGLQLQSSVAIHRHSNSLQIAKTNASTSVSEDRFQSFPARFRSMVRVEIQNC
jgi:hypothetical protein